MNMFLVKTAPKVGLKIESSCTLNCGVLNLRNNVDKGTKKENPCVIKRQVSKCRCSNTYQTNREGPRI